jgi:putative inorganic carbon (HCO3(-)) transporter
MIIRDFPFTGVGMGNFGIVVDTLYPFLLNSAGSVPHAHNLYLQIAVDLGLPGLIAWLAILLTMLTTSWNLFQKGKRCRDFYCSGLGAGLMCCQIALAIHGLIDSVTWGMVRPAPMVWAMWGISVAAAEIYQAPPIPHV